MAMLGKGWTNHEGWRGLDTEQLRFRPVGFNQRQGF